MNIIIDAYNLLKQLHAVTRITESQRSKFIDQLKYFARAKKHDIYLVFDGGESARPYTEYNNPVVIIHSGYKLTADEVIQQKIRSYTQDHTLLVSDDRQLCDSVAAAGYAAVGTADFYKSMLYDIKKQDKIFMQKGVATKKSGYASSPELDELMQQASSVGYYKDVGEIDLDSGQERENQLSRKEKKLKKLAKKL